MEKQPNEPVPSRRRFLAGLAGAGAALASGEVAAKAFQGDIDAPKEKVETPRDPETNVSPEQQQWDLIAKRLLEGLSRITKDKALSADAERFNYVANETFIKFYSEAADFKGAGGAQSPALDMYFLHYLMENSSSKKVEPAVKRILDMAWEQTADTAIKDSLASLQQNRRTVNFVPDDTA